MPRLSFTKLPGQKWNSDSVHQDRTNGLHDSVNQLLFKNQPAGIWGRETKHFHKEDKTEREDKLSSDVIDGVAQSTSKTLKEGCARLSLLAPLNHKIYVADTVHSS